MMQRSAAGGAEWLGWSAPHCGHAMSLRPVLVLACGLLAAGPVAAANWQAVPGAADVEVDLASLQQERTHVLAWLRWWGRPPLVPELAAHGMRLPRVQRTAVRAEFDCSRRTLRTLAAHAYDGNGTPVLMSSVPGPVLPVQGADLVWTYDAVCEAARAAARS
jgi:hypothetical protein